MENETDLLVVKNQCERWIKDAEEMAIIFEDKHLTSLSISETAKVAAYKKVINFIEENLLDD